MPRSKTKNQWKKTVLTIVLLFLFITEYCQEFNRPLEGKSLVYFVRFSGAGAVINFKYFDGEKYLGKMNGRHYFAYECEPGAHIFWVASENRDYIQGDLLANETYVIEVRPTMGAFKAAVRLHQVAPNHETTLKRVGKIMAKKNAYYLEIPWQKHGVFYQERNSSVWGDQR